MKNTFKFFILFLGFILCSQNVLAQTINIPWDEVRALYGDRVAENARRMVEQGTSPLLIRELDKWTGQIHFEYKLPGGSTGNVNIWVYDPQTGQVSWSGPGPAPYSPEEALAKIQRDLQGYNVTDPGDASNPSLQNTTQQISFLANNQKNLTVYPGDIINYTWVGPTGEGYTYSSYYTIDGQDNCGWGIQPGETKPWIANTQQGNSSAQVQQCQAGRTYTITYAAKDSSGRTIQTSVVVRVLSGQRPQTTQQISFLANNQKNLTVYPGDIINYTWVGPTGEGYTYSSYYTIDGQDNCGWGIQPGETKPWIANTQQGNSSAQVQQCQAGRTYTITYAAKDSSGRTIQTSVVVRVLSGQRPQTTSTIPPSSTQQGRQIPQNQNNPFDPTYFSGRTTIAGVTDTNRTVNAVNSLSSIIDEINSILNRVNNLNIEGHDAVIKALQSILNALKDLITAISKNIQTQTNQVQSTKIQTTQTQIQTQTQTQITVSQKSTVSTSTNPDSKISVSIIPTTTTFRYIKNDITQQGWVAIREMKFYDKDGKEIKPVNATASCDWCGYGTPPEYSVGPRGVFDNDPYKVWNAGETAENCNWYIPNRYGLVGCSPLTIRKAWIKVDLGSPISLSKIRIQPMGVSHIGRIDYLFGSLDDKDYIPLCTIRGADNPSLTDYDWIECVFR